MCEECRSIATLTASKTTVPICSAQPRRDE
jgi:hypothetical protein